jgi:hypothetical protein
MRPQTGSILHQFGGGPPLLPVPRLQMFLPRTSNLISPDQKWSGLFLYIGCER